MKKGLWLSDELIAERQIEEFRESIKDGIRLASNQPEFRRVATRVFVSLAGAWGLSPLEASRLVGISAGEYEEWCRDEWESVGPDHIERISCLLGIYMNLCTLYSGHIDRVHRWLRRANNSPLFGGGTPYAFLELADVSLFHRVRREIAGMTV